MFGFEPGGTVYTRIGRIASSDGLVGYTPDALRDAVLPADLFNRLPRDMFWWAPHAVA
jgi:hypothetical protein